MDVTETLGGWRYVVAEGQPGSSVDEIGTQREFHILK